MTHFLLLLVIVISCYEFSAIWPLNMSLAFLTGLKVGRGIACEHKSLTLRCSKGRVIRVFYSLYGRRNRRTCAKGKPIKTTKCKAKDAQKIAKKSCEGKQTCRLSASNKVYGDPCKGTFKYLTVIYGCRSKLNKNVSN